MLFERQLVLTKIWDFDIFQGLCFYMYDETCVSASYAVPLGVILIWVGCSSKDISDILRENLPLRIFCTQNIAFFFTVREKFA